jgi:hypothetical protein
MANRFNLRLEANLSPASENLRSEQRPHFNYLRGQQELLPKQLRLLKGYLPHLLAGRKPFMVQRKCDPPRCYL